MTIYIPLCQVGTVSSPSLSDRVDYFLYMETDIIGVWVTMTSLEIADLTGKDHKNIMRDIRSMFEKLEIGELNFESTYIDSQNKERPMFRLDKRRVQILIMWYEPKLCDKVLDYIDTLEKQKVVPAKELTLAEMTLKVIAGFQEEVEQLKWTVIHKQRQLNWAKWWHTAAKNKLKIALTESEKKAAYYEKQAEENKKAFWWNK